MPLNYLNLDEETRSHMNQEINFDKQHNNFYFGKNLTAEGQNVWPSLLEESVAYDDEWLEHQIQMRHLLEQFTTRRNPKGGISQVRVPVNAAQRLAEGEFNRLYARGVALRVVAGGGGNVEVYRARDSENPRPESEALIGRRFDAAEVLEDLRTNQGANTVFGVPGGPNSGLSIKL